MIAILEEGLSYRLRTQNLTRCQMLLLDCLEQGSILANLIQYPLLYLTRKLAAHSMVRLPEVIVSSVGT